MAHFATPSIQSSLNRAAGLSKVKLPSPPSNKDHYNKPSTLTTRTGSVNILQSNITSQKSEISDLKSTVARQQKEIETLKASQGTPQ
ncbi:MAG: hypothetical protein K2K75_13280 [Muribaculaceae bacterium]|nr:hypothetical protein [Muribaculaceae bacterium]